MKAILVFNLDDSNEDLYEEMKKYKATMIGKDLLMSVLDFQDLLRNIQKDRDQEFILRVKREIEESKNLTKKITGKKPKETPDLVIDCTVEVLSKYFYNIFTVNVEEYL